LRMQLVYVTLISALFASLALSASTGTFLAVNSFPNNTNAVVSVGPNGDLTYISGGDNKLMQTASFTTFPSAAIVGQSGIYYCSGMISNGASVSGVIFAFSKDGSKNIATVSTPLPVLSIAEDVYAGKLFTFIFDLNGERVSLVSWSLPLTSSSTPTKIASLEPGWLGISTGGSYDPNNGVFYVYLIGQTANAGTIIGVSVADGSIASNTTQLNTVTIVTAISVDASSSGSRHIALTQDPNDPKALFFLSTIDVDTGLTTKIGASTFLDQNWTPMSISVNSAARRWVGTFQNNAGDASLVVVDLDTGKPLKSMQPWPQGTNVNELFFSSSSN